MLEEGKQSRNWISILLPLFFTVLMVFGSALVAQQFSFGSNNQDLGTVYNPQGLVGVEFQCCNHSLDTLRFTSVKTASYNSVNYPLTGVSPGECGKIEFRYYAVASNSSFRKFVIVHTNLSPDPVVLQMKGKIVHGASPSFPSNSLEKCP